MKLKPLGVSKTLRAGLVLVSKYAKDNMPKLLTMGSVACLGSAVYYTGKGTVKAVRLIDKRELEKGAPLTTGEKIKEVWPCYVKAAVATVGSAGCAIGATHMLLTQNTALAAALAASEAKNRGLLEKPNELLEERTGDSGEKRAEDTGSFVNAANEDVFLDTFTGREFVSSKSAIEFVCSELSVAAVTGDTITMNDIYYELDLPQAKAGEKYGFNTAFKPVFTPEFNSDGKSVTAVDFDPIHLKSEE